MPRELALYSQLTDNGLGSGTARTKKEWGVFMARRED